MHSKILQAIELLKNSTSKTKQSYASVLPSDELFITREATVLPWNESHSDIANNWTLQNYKYFVSINSATRDTLVIMCYSVIILISVLGNSLVFHVVFSKSGLKSATNIFIGNLAISDLVLTCFGAPFHVARLLMDNWNLGKFLCVSVSVVQSVSVSVSTLTMACIALDRYTLLNKPFEQRARKVPAKIKVIVIWVIAVLSSAPYVLYTDIKTVFTFRELVRCAVIYPEPSKEYRKWITVGYFIILYILPLGTAGVAYGRIIYLLWYRKTVGTVTRSQRLQQRRAKWRSIKMLMLVVVIFAVCWLPLNVYHVYNDCFGLMSPWKHRSTIFLLCHWFAMSSICYNPFIYCYLNEKFKSTASAYFTSICKVLRICRTSYVWLPKCEGNSQYELLCQRINRIISFNGRSRDSSLRTMSVNALKPPMTSNPANFSETDIMVESQNTVTNKCAGKAGNLMSRDLNEEKIIDNNSLKICFDLKNQESLFDFDSYQTTCV